MLIPRLLEALGLRQGENPGNIESEVNVILRPFPLRVRQIAAFVQVLRIREVQLEYVSSRLDIKTDR